MVVHMADKLNVAIIDYEMGNVKSIENAIAHIGDYNVVITADSSVILSSDIIILPGVGAFPDAMKKLSEKGLISVLDKAVRELKKPTIGICLGMQLLFDVSEEKEITDVVSTALKFKGSSYWLELFNFAACGYYF